MAAGAKRSAEAEEESEEDGDDAAIDDLECRSQQAASVQQRDRDDRDRSRSRSMSIDSRATSLTATTMSLPKAQSMAGSDSGSAKCRKSLRGGMKDKDPKEQQHADKKGKKKDPACIVNDARGTLKKILEKITFSAYYDKTTTGKDVANAISSLSKKSYVVSALPESTNGPEIASSILASSPRLEAMKTQ